MVAMNRGNDDNSSTESDVEFLSLLASILADARRRRVLVELMAGARRRALGDLVEALTVAEGPDATGVPWSETRREVATTLHHIHLPKLDDQDVVDYDIDDRVVELTERGFECAQALGVESND